MTDSLEWVNNFVGVPYLVNGRDRKGWDCWGLVMAAFQEVKGIALPDWRVDTTFTHHAEVTAAIQAITQGAEHAAAAGQAVRLDAPEHMAVVMVHRFKRPNHVGVIVGDNAVLHCAEAVSNTVCEPLAAFLRSYPNVSYWKWVG